MRKKGELSKEINVDASQAEAKAHRRNDISILKTKSALKMLILQR